MIFIVFSHHMLLIYLRKLLVILLVYLMGRQALACFSWRSFFFSLFFFPVISMFEFRHLAVVELICIPFRLTTRKKERVFTVHCIPDSSQCLLPLSVGAALPAPLSTLPVARSPPQCCQLAIEFTGVNGS